MSNEDNEQTERGETVRDLDLPDVELGEQDAERIRGGEIGFPALDSGSKDAAK